MASDLLNIQPYVIDPSLEGKIFWFYGEAGTRKTSVAAKFPSALILATERGYKYINGCYAKDIASWNEFKRVLVELKDDEVRTKFKTLVFDRIDTLYEMCIKYVLARLGVDDLSGAGYGKGWKTLKDELKNTFRTIENLGYGIVFISHDKDITKNMEKVGSKLDLEKTGALIFKGMCDFIFNVRKEITEDGRQTVMAYSDCIDAESKKRPRYFTSKFEFTFENLKKEHEEAIKKQINMEGCEVRVQEHKESEKRSIEEIKKSILELATPYRDTPKMEEINECMNIQLQSANFKEVGQSYYDELLVIETFLIGLADE